MSNPDLLIQEIFTSARAAVAEGLNNRECGATFTPDEVAAMLRSYALAWYARGARDVHVAVRMSLEARDAGLLQ